MLLLAGLDSSEMVSDKNTEYSIAGQRAIKDIQVGCKLPFLTYNIY